MKVILGTIILFILQNILKCDDTLESNSKFLIKSKNPGKLYHKSIKLLNARKFANLKAYDNRRVKALKENDDKQTYTVFPPAGVPVSYMAEYPVELPERKPRVKKVLPEYEHTVVRRKRSPTNATVTKLQNADDTIKLGNNDSPNDTLALTRKHGKREKSESSSLVSRNSSHKKTKLRKNKQAKKSSKVKSNDPDDIKVIKHRSNGTKLRKHKLRKAPVSHKNSEKAKRSRKGTKKIAKRKGKNGNKKKKSLRHGNNKGGERKVRNRRLIAARDAMIQDYPYVVSIQKSGEHWCTGTLLNQRMVITTANCIWKSNRMSRLRIRACSRHYDQGGQVAKIMEVMKHPRWSIRSSPDNDVGLLLLDRNIKFSHSCHSADLPNRAMLPAFDDAWVTSWGAERRDGVFESSSRPLQVYHAQLLDHSKCNNVTQRFGVTVSRNFICLAQTGRRAPCTRDTGAPAVSDGIVWGIASWGIRKLCGTERFPAMFSYLASPSNIDFITNSTLTLMSDERFYPYADRFRVYQAETSTGMVPNKL